MSINKSMKEPVMVKAPPKKTIQEVLKANDKEFSKPNVVTQLKIFLKCFNFPPWFSSRSRNDAASAAFPG